MRNNFDIVKEAETILENLNKNKKDKIINRQKEDNLYLYLIIILSVMFILISAFNFILWCLS